MLRRPAPLLPLRKPCPTCGRPLAVQEGGGERCKPICPTCDGPDPLHSPKALRWAKGSLRPPTRPQNT